MSSNENLIRRQFYISKDNDAKLESMAKAKGVSKADILRNAIEAYTPDSDEVVLAELIRKVQRSNVEVNKLLDEAISVSQSVVGPLLAKRKSNL